MEKIINEVCNIVIDNSYKNFTSSVYEFNNKIIADLSRININEIYDEVLIISDENVYNYQLDNFINNIKAKMIYEYIVPEGEDSKSLSVYEEIIKYCIRINLSRKSLIIALGGGVVGDLAGFVASTYMRGIDVCQIPTSLLLLINIGICLMPEILRNPTKPFTGGKPSPISRLSAGDKNQCRKWRNKRKCNHWKFVPHRQI